jgi:hypothetical protein
MPGLNEFNKISQLRTNARPIDPLYVKKSDFLTWIFTRLFTPDAAFGLG